MPPVSPVGAFIRRFFVALVLVVVVTTGAIGVAYAIAAHKVNGIATANIDPSVLEGGRNFLLIGSDTRAFVTTPQQAQAFGSAQSQTGQRSDTIMLAHVDPGNGGGFIVSLPRDLWVDIPGMGHAKINAAFNAGPQRVIETIEQDFNVPVAHYLEVDFEGFRNIVNALGTVPIYFPTPARDVNSGLSVATAGCQNLNGDQALAYVRSRYYEYFADGAWHYDPSSDLGRIRRQQYFIRTLAQQTLQASERKPWRAQHLLDEMFGSLTRDPTLGLSGLRSLAYAMRGGSGGGVETTTVPTHPSHIDGQDVLLLDDAGAAPLFARLRAGTTAPPKVPANVSPSSVSVAVDNATGRAGLGASTLAAFGAHGFVTAGPAGNATLTDPSTTEVRYAAGKESEAELVRAYLGGAGKLVAGVTGGADVLVVLGGDFQGVSAPTATTTPTTAAAATNPASGTTTPATTPPAPTPGGGAFPVAGC